MGGIETHVSEVAPRLVRMGFEITVLTTDLSGELPAREERDGFKVVRIAAYPRDRDYYFAPGIGARIRPGSYDLVHLQGYHNLVAPLTMAAAWRAKVPYLVSLHSGGHSAAVRRAARGVQRLLLRPGLRRARKIIAVSRYELELFSRSLRLAPSRFALIRNGSHLPAVDVDADPTPLVLSIGRLERYKGHHRVIEAWPRVLDAIPEARLQVVGEGPYRPALEALIDRLRLGDRVTIRSVPPGNPAQMAQLMGRSRLVTLLSDYEAHPVAVSEALAARRPVLVARTSGLTELADAGLAAGVAAAADAEVVAEAVVMQLRQPRLPDVTLLPTWDDCAEQLGDLYRASGA
jgi:glycosyltransferase involved in cell wall biosynthesis